MDQGPDAPTISQSTSRRVEPWPAVITGLGTFALILLIGLGVWAFAPSDAPAITPPANVDELPYADGVMVVVDLPRLVLESYSPVDGKREIEFRVRDSDLKYFDVVHLRAHSSIGLPTRVFYERDGDTYWAVYKEDAPANSTDEAGK